MQHSAPNLEAMAAAPPTEETWTSRRRMLARRWVLAAPPFVSHVVLKAESPNGRVCSCSRATILCAAWIVSCGGVEANDDPNAEGTGGNAGSVSRGGGAGLGAGGSAGRSGGSGEGGSGPSSGAGGGSGGAGRAGTAGGGSSAAGTGGLGAAGSGAGAASGGSGGAGATAGSGFGGAAGMPAVPPLDCGEEGWAVESHGAPANRINYVIVGDGYTAATVDTTLVQHINTMLARRFNHESGQPYGRYRKFVNICVMKAISQNDGIGNGPTAFEGGNGGDRLARVNEEKVNDYLREQLPVSFEVDWKAVVLNQDLWENTGSALMLWSGAHAEAAGAALHEGGHGFHQLADEYCASGTGARCEGNTEGSGAIGDEHAEMNSTGDPMTTGRKWDLWLGTTQKGLNTPDMGATGVQGTFQGSRYVDDGQYRPSLNSMMNSLFGEELDTSFNSVSREQIIFTIWRAVKPIDSTEPPAGTITSPAPVNGAFVLKVNVIDPAVINVDWTIDGVTTVNAGTTFDTSTLSAGSHTIVAKAYDNATTDLVKLRTSMCPSAVTGRYCAATAWKNSQQEVAWSLTKP
jgi:hypothetical protein